MKARHIIFVFATLVLFGFLTGCSNWLYSTDDPNTPFNEQLAAFENPPPGPDDQMPPGYDTDYQYRYQGDSNTMYSGSYDSSLAYSDDRGGVSSPKRHAMLGGSGGGAEEVPFSETRKNKTSQPNIGAL